VQDWPTPNLSAIQTSSPISVDVASAERQLWRRRSDRVRQIAPMPFRDRHRDSPRPVRRILCGCRQCGHDEKHAHREQEPAEKGREVVLRSRAEYETDDREASMPTATAIELVLRFGDAAGR